MPAAPHELDPQVIRIALGRDPVVSVESQRRAFARLYECYEPRVRYAVARASMRAVHPHRADDIRQEVWCRLSRRPGVLRYYDETRGTFGAFIGRLAYQQALAVLRTEHRKTVHSDTVETFEEERVEDTSALAHDAEFIQADFYQKLMARVAAELDEDERVMLQELFFRDRSALAFASARGINKQTVYKRKQRLKDKLRTIALELLGATGQLVSSVAHTGSMLTVAFGGGGSAAVSAFIPSTDQRSPDPDSCFAPNVKARPESEPAHTLVVNVEPDAANATTDQLVSALKTAFPADPSGTLQAIQERLRRG